MKRSSWDGKIESHTSRGRHDPVERIDAQLRRSDAWLQRAYRTAIKHGRRRQSIVRARFAIADALVETSRDFSEAGLPQLRVVRTLQHGGAAA
jgi:hypothetical protein